MSPPETSNSRDPEPASEMGLQKQTRYVGRHTSQRWSRGSIGREMSFDMRTSSRAPIGRSGVLAALPSRAMPDPIFADPRLAEIYDDLDADRSDLDAYVAIAEAFHARSALDIGCGTGVFACLLARKGLDVIAVDPAGASLAVARRKPEANQVRWLLGDATTLPAMQVDLATMTGNIAQVFLTDEDWMATLNGIRDALRPGGRLVFEVRDRARQAWRSWNAEASYSTVDIPGIGVVESWVEVTRVADQLVSFTWTFRFQHSGDVITSDSTLCFRERAEIEASLQAAHLRLVDVRDAPDRPGIEFVFITERA
jgi:SAM-dependent methyltransferase